MLSFPGLMILSFAKKSCFSFDKKVSNENSSFIEWFLIQTICPVVLVSAISQSDSLTLYVIVLNIHEILSSEWFSRFWFMQKQTVFFFVLNLKQTISHPKIPVLRCNQHICENKRKQCVDDDHLFVCSSLLHHFICSYQNLHKWSITKPRSQWQIYIHKYGHIFLQKIYNTKPIVQIKRITTGNDNISCIESKD